MPRLSTPAWTQAGRIDQRHACHSPGLTHLPVSTAICLFYSTAIRRLTHLASLTTFSPRIWRYQAAALLNIVRDTHSHAYRTGSKDLTVPDRLSYGFWLFI